MTLQQRLTILYLLLAIAAVASLGAAVYFIAAERISTNVDEGLESSASAVEAALIFVDDPITRTDVQQGRQALDRQIVQGAVFQIRSPDGDVLFSSAGGSRPLPASSEGIPVAGFETVDTRDGEVRTLVRPIVRVGRNVAFLETRTSLTFANESLAEIRTVLLLGGLVVGAASALGAYYIAGRAVKPVRDVSNLAREIEKTSDFTRRLPEATSSIEMVEMTRTFNRMIARVDRMVAGQRAFLSDTSHELRRPLTILRTNIDVLSSPRLADEERATVEQEMREAAESMSALLADLLVLARSDERSGTVQTFDISALCQSALRRARQHDERHIYEADIDPDLTLAGDEQGFSRAIANLLQNAASYSDAGSSICVRLKAEDGSVVLDVQDEGIGMSEEDKAHVFDRFYRGSSARDARPDGLGLGLAMVKQVVDSQDGEIRIESAEGRGTTMTLILPSSPDRRG